MLGTQWTAPGNGATQLEIFKAFGASQTLIENAQAHPSFTERTNLALTGAPITEYDWQRLESEAFKVGE